MPHSKLETGKNGKHLWIQHHKERGEHKGIKNFVLSAFLW